VYEHVDVARIVKKRRCSNEGGPEKMLGRMTSNCDVLPFPKLDLFDND
jgi:hypothetical protein